MNKLIIIIIILLVLVFVSVLILSRQSFGSISISMKNNVYNTAYELGINYLKIMKQHKFYNLERPAVMFDIDGTVIDYSGKPIKPIIDLLNKCIEMNLIVIIITARESKYTQETIKELSKNKIKYDMLYLRKPEDNVNVFKSNIKKYLKEVDNITTIMSIGDNIIDVDGEYSGYFIKLPNEHDKRLFHLNSDKKIELIN